MSVVFLGASKFATRLFDNYLQWPVPGLIPLIAVAALIACLIAFCTFVSCRWYRRYPPVIISWVSCLAGKNPFGRKMILLANVQIIA